MFPFFCGDDEKGGDCTQLNLMKVPGKGLVCS